MCIPVAIMICVLAESKRWSNIALTQPAWSSFNFSTYPASQAVDNDVTTSSQAGPDMLPFLTVDLGSNVPVGFVSLRFAESRLPHTGHLNLSQSHGAAREFQPYLPSYCLY